MPDARTARFDALVTPHLTTLYRVAYRLVRNAADAHDLVQDTCIAACEHMATLAVADHPHRWLLRVLQNRFLNQAKRQRRAPVVALNDNARAELVPSPDPGPAERLQQEELALTIERAFLQLDDTQRTLLSLRAEGYGLTEIEAITGIEKAVLRARLHRARRSLSQHLEARRETDTWSASRPRSAP